MLPLLLSALLLSLPLNAQTANQTSADPVKAQLVRQQLTANIPPGNSLSPSRYAALFPGFIETSNDTGFSCKVFTTPVPGVSYADDRISTNSPRWTCPAGYFCLSPGFDDMIKCTPGFYCPENTAQPNYCCSRFACSEDATTAVLCPENHYCPTGTVTPIRCNFLANCPKGSKQATKIGIAAVFFAFAIMVWFGFAIKTKSERRRNAKYSILAKALQSDRAQTSNRDATSLGPVEHKFNIRFEDLGLVLPNGVEVMRSVTGQLSAGRSCAVMGPSGAGKTTFINLLTGKVKRTSGRVFINGKAEELKKYKKLIGFVPQEDNMIRELTVREILLHSAKMRLPTHWPSSKKTKKVLETIDYLGMGHVMDSVIGDAEQRGISGGQRKRVNIGMELVAAPSVLFLDEPTSGLDSSTSYEVCLLLRSIAHEQSLTVAAVIHSPSQQAFRQFDDLLLLGKGGRVCFFGPMDNAINYFSNIGFPCPSSENPADYLMDVVSGKVQSQLDSTFKASDLFHLWEYHGRTNAQDRSLEKGLGSSSTINLMHPIDLEEARPMPFHDGVGDLFWRVMLSTLDIFRDIGLWIVDVIWELLVTIKNCLLFFFKDPVRSTPNVFVVFWLCYRRACLQIYRSRSAFFSDQLLHLFCGAFISVAAREMDYLGEQPPEICQISPVALQQSCTSPTDHVREIGIFLCLGVGFAGISVGAVTFGAEKVIYWRDSAAGMSTIPFFLAKFMADIPRIVLAGFMFSLSLILFFPYRSDFSTIYTLVTLLYFVFFSMGYLLSAVVRRDAIGLVGTGFALAWSLVFSGVTPALTDVYDPTSTVYAPISWLWNVSAPRHAIEALYVQEVAARPFREAQAKEFGYTYEFDRYGPALIMMCYIGIGWLVAGFLGLKLTNRDRMK